jgi:hypothetical protein
MLHNNIIRLIATIERLYKFTIIDSLIEATQEWTDHHRIQAAQCDFTPLDGNVNFTNEIRLTSQAALLDVIIMTSLLITPLNQGFARVQ